MTKKEFETKIKAIGEIDEEARNKIACALIGHSKIVSMCFGYVSCGRCGEQIGDTLAGYYNTSKCVVIGHDCDTCHTNYNDLDWKDKIYCPDPFKKEAK